MMPEFDPVTMTVLLPWWAVAVALCVFVLLLVFAFIRGGPGRTVGALAQFALVLAAVSLAWSFLDRMAIRDRADERRAIEARISELTARAITPGSALACLDAAAGDLVEQSCEKALFATPEQVAAAVSYVGARLTLLADATEASHRGGGYEQSLARLRRAAETDRFGLVAHVLATRDGCNADKCDALELLRDPAQVLANLKERSFDTHLSRYAASWGVKGSVLAGAPSGQEAAPAAPAPAAPAVPAAASMGVNFPSAASIPAVSIMNNEPGMPGQNGVDQQAAPQPQPPAKRAAKAPRKADPAQTRAAETAGAPIPIAPQRPPSAPPRAENQAPAQTQTQ